jgi:hypothetical protein
MLQSSNITKEEMAENPQAVMDVLGFYAENLAKNQAREETKAAAQEAYDSQNKQAAAKLASTSKAPSMGSNSALAHIKQPSSALLSSSDSQKYLTDSPKSKQSQEKQAVQTQNISFPSKPEVSPTSAVSKDTSKGNHIPPPPPKKGVANVPPPPPPPKALPEIPAVASEPLFENLDIEEKPAERDPPLRKADRLSTMSDSQLMDTLRIFPTLNYRFNS